MVSLTILHANIHPLPCFRRMCMNSISGEKYSVLVREIWANPLPDLVSCEPITMLIGQIIWRNYLPSLFKYDFRGYGRPIYPCAVGSLCHLAVDADDFVLPRNDHHTSGLGRMYGTPFSNIRKVCDWNNVEHAPA